MTGGEHDPPDIHIETMASPLPEHGQEPPHLVLSAEDKAELAKLAQVVEYKTAGSRILTQGEPATFLFLLAAGMVRVDRMLNDGERQVLAFYWPGDLFGLAENGIYINSAEALTPCIVHRFPYQGLHRLLRTNANVQHGFFVKALDEWRKTQRQLIVMGRFDIPKRLAIFLLDCSAHEEYFSLRTGVLTLPMTRYDIADYLGTSAESVTRALARMEREGLLRRSGTRSLTLKIDQLRKFVNFT